ncbi:hypothetical protein [Hymenobacter koreensis]|uniref:NnrS family protein n=1 Tax=Hymenobacter koreensis TaxID=1084523 RepID=A0ABP8J2F0_9BACT
MLIPARWLTVALLNLAIAAALGALLRFVFLHEVPGVEYRNVMHAHSHGAMLGWVFLALFAAYMQLAQPAAGRLRWYRRVFWAAEATVLGMFVAFSWQGYGAVSITLSTAHMLLSYGAVVLLWPDLRRQLAGRAALPYLLAGLGSVVVSTLGLWALAGIMSRPHPNTELYYLAIQFFLHFQLNSWFAFGVLGLVLSYFEAQQLPLHRGLLRRAFWLLVPSTFLTYGLAVAWAERHPLVYAVTGVGVVLQLLGLATWLRAVWPAWLALLPRLSPLLRALWAVGLGSFAFKGLIHAAVAVPYVAVMAFTVRNYVIGFVHLVTLGATTLTLLGLLHQVGALHLQRPAARVGAGLLLAGFLLTEALLFVQGSMFWLNWSFLPHYYLLLLLASLPLPAGALLLLASVRASRAEAAAPHGPRPNASLHPIRTAE